MSVDLLHILTSYLASNKRLVVPQLGAFLVKEPGKTILFSELMKRDDGVLRGLLCATGMGEIEASGCIDRFVYEVRRAVEEGRSYPMPGFGEMRPGPNGTIAFVYEQTVPVVESAAVVAEPQPLEPEKPVHINTDRMAETMRTAFKNEAKNEAGEEEDSVGRQPAAVAQEPATRRKPAYTLEEAYADHRPPKRKVDRFLLVAIAAALIAIAAIAFGFWREAQEQQLYDEAPLEMPADTSLE